MKTTRFPPARQVTLCTQAKLKFGRGFWVKPGIEWKGGSEVLWSGENCFMPDGLEAFNAYSEDLTESVYIMGVHKDLVKWAASKGLSWEQYDGGTWMAYPM